MLMLPLGTKIILKDYLSFKKVFKASFVRKVTESTPTSIKPWDRGWIYVISYAIAVYTEYQATLELSLSLSPYHGDWRQNFNG